MAYTFDEVQQKLNAEIVAGNLICGILDKRVFVGKTNEDGMFEITPEGKESQCLSNTRQSLWGNLRA